jgi:hypothetical protein
MSKPFKVRYQGRILAIGKNYLTSFDVFQKEVAKRFGLNEQSLLFNYVDDEGDNIELMNEDDFETYNGIEKKSIIDVKINDEFEKELKDLDKQRSLQSLSQHNEIYSQQQYVNDNQDLCMNSFNCNDKFLLAQQNENNFIQQQFQHNQQPQHKSISQQIIQPVLYHNDNNNVNTFNNQLLLNSNPLNIQQISNNNYPHFNEPEIIPQPIPNNNYPILPQIEPKESIIKEQNIAVFEEEITFEVACKECSSFPLTNQIFRCQKCKFYICSYCIFTFKQKHLHPLKSITSIPEFEKEEGIPYSQLFNTQFNSYLEINQKPPVNSLINQETGHMKNPYLINDGNNKSYEIKEKDVLGNFIHSIKTVPNKIKDAIQDLDSRNKNSNSAEIKKLPLIQQARRKYSLHSFTDGQIEYALRQSNNDIDQAVALLLNDNHFA